MATKKQTQNREMQSFRMTAAKCNLNTNNSGRNVFELTLSVLNTKYKTNRGTTPNKPPSNEVLAVGLKLGYTLLVRAYVQRVRAGSSYTNKQRSSYLNPVKELYLVVSVTESILYCTVEKCKISRYWRYT